MSYSILILFLVSLLSCNSSNQEHPTNHDNHEKKEEHNHGNHEEVKKKSKSPRKMAMAMVAGNHIHIDYSSPSVRGRKIFGGLVAYDEVWVTGAHKATNISFDKPVSISGVEVPKGKYGLFTIPGKEEWTIIINKQWDMHLADDYSEAEDVVRVSVKPQTLSESIESLTFEVLDENGTGNIIIKWADVQVSFEAKSNN